MVEKNLREDVIVYFETYAQLLEEQLIEQIQIPTELFKTNNTIVRELEMAGIEL